MSRVGVEIVMILQANEIRSVLNAAIKTKALRSELFSVKALSARLRKLTELTKQFIAIIIVSFVIAKINGN